MVSPTGLLQNITFKSSTVLSEWREVGKSLRGRKSTVAKPDQQSSTGKIKQGQGELCLHSTKAIPLPPTPCFCLEHRSNFPSPSSLLSCTAKSASASASASCSILSALPRSCPSSCLASFNVVPSIPPYFSLSRKCYVILPIASRLCVCLLGNFSRN